MLFIRVPLQIGRQVHQFTEHLVDINDRAVNEVFASAGLHPRAGTCCTVTATGSRADGWEISIVPVCLAEQKRCRHRAPIAPVHLKFYERLARHGHERDLFIDEHSCGGQVENPI